MKRRDLLKGASTLVLGAPAIRAAALLKSHVEPAQSQKKGLVVAFSGPFCFWQESGSFKVMAPPVGTKSHMPWVGTTANTKEIKGSKDFKLEIPGYVAPLDPPPFIPGTTPCFSYEQGTPLGVPPMFNFSVPMPTQIVGVRPTGVQIVCKPGTTYPYCGKFITFASGMNFVYNDIAVDQITVTTSAGTFFKPCFINDAPLQEATLGVHLTSLNPLDLDHSHAKRVWREMMSMYPWMLDDLTTEINFCPGFDPSTCPASCGPGVIAVNPSSDCQAPIMWLPPGSGGNAKSRKK